MGILYVRNSRLMVKAKHKQATIVNGRENRAANDRKIIAGTRGRFKRLENVERHRSMQIRELSEY